MSAFALHFSRQGNAIAVIAGAALLAVCGYAAVIGGFPDVNMIGRCGSPNRIFVKLNCATNGWLALAFFGGCFLFFLPVWARSIHRLFTSIPAVYLAEERLEVHSSFLLSDRLIPYSSIRSVVLTTEGAAMGNGTRSVSRAITPVGSGWIVSRSERKICAVIIYLSKSQRQRKLKISAQFIDRGKWALGDFVTALEERTALENS